MLQMQLANLEDFKTLVKKEKIAFRRKDKEGNHYYVLSRFNEIPVLFLFSSENPLDFSFNFEFGEEKIIIESLIDVEGLSFL